MNALVKKEVRLLLPGGCAVLLMETLLPWVYQDADYVFSYTPVAFFLGLIILTVDAFGREFSLGTFQSLMSQPIERQKIWRTKITLLMLAVGLITLAYFASCGLRVHQAILASDSPWRFNSSVIRSDFHNAMLASAALLLVALTGGLWTSLLLRQTASAFWVTFLLPVTMMLLLALCLPNRLVDQLDKHEHLLFGLLYLLAVLYSLGSFWLAYRLFHRAQDVGWSGGVISFSRWRYFERGGPAGVSRRVYRPWAALLKKELQLHSVSLLCAGGLLAVHLGVFSVRALYGRFHPESMVYLFTNGFWVFWLVVPAIMGCTAVAEERKLGVVDGQFCLPVSRRRQFAVKFLPALILGTFLGGVVPLFLEIVAGHLGTTNEFFKPDAHSSNRFVAGYDLFLASVVALAMGLFWLGILASTLTKSFLQALSSTIAGGVLLLALASWARNNCTLVTPLPVLIALPVIPGTLLWLSWLNYDRFQEGWRLWRRNVLGIAGAAVFIAASSAAIYHRAWEVFEPAEPAHGPARFTLADPPKLNARVSGDLSVHWPDGRVWCDTLDYSAFWGSFGSWRQLLGVLLRPEPGSSGPRQFIAGSNWVSVTTEHIDYLNPERNKERTHERIRGYLVTLGVKRDGTLWISRATKLAIWNGADMVQVENGTNWRQAARWQNGVVLLKTDGTLWWWSWGTNGYDSHSLQTNWPTFRHQPLRQIGTNTDWQELAGLWAGGLARKTDGSTWSLGGWPSPELKRQTNLDQTVLQTFSQSGRGQWAFVANDGTLRVSIGSATGAPVGLDTNWLAVKMSYNWLVALRRDGTLWKWNLPGNGASEFSWFFTQKPARLGIHHDWVGLAATWNSIVTLAADGSLWSWPGTDAYEFALMKPPKQPQSLGNVFGE